MSKHQTIVVTGGSTGIGAAICDVFLERGLQVVNLSRRPLVRSLQNLINVPLDLSDRDATERIASEIASEYPVSGLVHNAGLIRPSLLDQVELKDVDYLSQVHIGAAVVLSQALIPRMKVQEFGRIVLITSRAALGLKKRTSYAATKAGMIGMARTWALELGEYGITVNSVAPGPIEDTEMFTSTMQGDEEGIASLSASIPVGRLGKSKDVAHAVAFLCDESTGFITGQTLMVCGGASLGSLAL